MAARGVAAAAEMTTTPLQGEAVPQNERRRSSLAKSMSKFQERKSFVFGRRKSSVVSQESSESSSLGRLFMALPPELQVHTILHLPLLDILNLRLVSQPFNAVIESNQSEITRECLRAKLPSRCAMQYARPDSSMGELRVLYMLAHRYSTTSRLAKELADFVRDEWLRQTSAKKRRRFASDHEKLSKSLFAPLFTICCLDEARRQAVYPEHRQRAREPWLSVEESEERQRQANQWRESPFSEADLLEAYYANAFVVAAVKRRSRPPTYATPVEKSVRGWLSRPVRDEVRQWVMGMGGLGFTGRILGAGSYAERRKLITRFYQSFQLLSEQPDFLKTWQELFYGPLALPADGQVIRDWITTPHEGYVPSVERFLEEQWQAFRPPDDQMNSPAQFVGSILGYGIVERLRYYNSLAGEVQLQEEGGSALDREDGAETFIKSEGGRRVDAWWTDSWIADVDRMHQHAEQ